MNSDWAVCIALCSVCFVTTLFAVCVVRLLSTFSSSVKELAKLSRARDLKDVSAYEHANDSPVFVEPPSDEMEAEIEELVRSRKAVPPHLVPGQRLRGEPEE